MTVYTREAHPHVLNSISQHTSMSDRMKVSAVWGAVLLLSETRAATANLSL